MSTLNVLIFACTNFHEFYEFWSIKRKNTGKLNRSFTKFKTSKEIAKLFG